MKAMNLRVTISPAVPAPAIAVNFSVRQIVRSDTIGTMDYAIVETAFLDGNGDPVEPPGVYNLMALDTICMHFHPASAVCDNIVRLVPIEPVKSLDSDEFVTEVRSD